MQRIVGKYNVQGFTLIELLLTVVLIGCIASALYGGLIANLRLHARAVELHELNRTIIKLSNALDSDFRNISWYGNGELQVDSNNISLHSLIFHKISPNQQVLQEGIIKYTIDNSTEESNCIVRHTRIVNTLDSMVFTLPSGYKCTFTSETEDFGNMYCSFHIVKKTQDSSDRLTIFEKRIVIN